MLMNSEFALTQANRFAKRLNKAGAQTSSGRSPKPLRSPLRRPATEAGIEDSVAFLDHQGEELSPSRHHNSPEKSPERSRFPASQPGDGSSRRGRARLAAAH